MKGEWERRETSRNYWWESQRERDHLEDQDIDIIKMDLEEI
jgi:alpha-glucosidase (family GH31 glycosyl hydrolase)